MLRHNSSIQSVLVYATFFTISLMIHMVVVWPRQTQASTQSAGDTAPVGTQASGTKGASGPQGGALK